MRFIFSAILLYVSFSLVSGQNSGSETGSASAPLSETRAISYYRQIMNRDWDVINGRDYLPYNMISKSNPFFKSTYITTGTVYSNRRTYPDLHIFYDIYKDELVLNRLNAEGSSKLISLNKQTVDSFLIVCNNVGTMFHTFFFPEGSTLKSGFYEVPLNGKTKLMIKHQKDYLLKDGQDQYNYRITRFVYLNGQFYPVTSRHRFLKIFGKRAREVKRYIQSMNTTTFRNLSDTDLRQILEHFDNIINE
jgi:hypothetical protein